jgi:hypothetical protein
MNNTIVIAAAIVAAALIVKLPIGSTPGRYQIAGSAGSHFRLARLSQLDHDLGNFVPAWCR